MRIHSMLLAMAVVGLLGASVTRGAEATGQTQTPALGIQAPEISAVTLDGKPVHLLDFRGKPVLLEFGCATEPLFRARVKDVQELAKKYDGKASVVIVYTRESHAADGPAALDLNTDEGFGLSQPVTMEEREQLAKQTADRLKIPASEVIVDNWNNFTSRAYGGYPNMTFLIDAKGVLQAGYAWMDPKNAAIALDAVVNGKEVPAESRGRTRPSAPDASDVMTMSMDMTGQRGPAGIGVMLDHLSLTDAQRMAIYQPIAQLLIDLRDIRQLSQPPANGAAPAAPPAAANGAGPAAVAPEDLATILERARKDAKTVDDTCKANLSPADYEKVMAVLKDGPQVQRLFGDAPVGRQGRGGRAGRAGRGGRGPQMVDPAQQ